MRMWMCLIGRRLTPSCKGIACCHALLQDLLSGQFNVTLGEKLSEHLKKWIDVGNILQPTQPVRLSTS